MIDIKTLVAAMMAAFTAGVALAYLRLRAIRAAHALHCASQDRVIQRLREEAMAMEARSRGVGGTGEHAPPIVTLIPDTSNVVRFTNVGRWSIPTDRRP